jgi:hypothetical protein
LRKVGVVSEGYDPLLGQEEDSGAAPPARILVDCLMLEPQRSWSAAEIAKATEIPLGRVYRTLLKFEALDWISDAGDPPKGALAGKRFQLRFGTLTDAWKFTELAAGLCLERYGRLAKALEDRVSPLREKPPKALAPPGGGGSPREAFVLRLSDKVLMEGGAPKELAAQFLNAVGAIPDRTGGRKPQALPSFRLFYSAFLVGGDRWWSFEELAKIVPSTRPTLLKHLRRLEALDLLERAAFPDEFGFPRRRWRLRHGSIARAFEFTDARARIALDGMARWAEHLQKLTDASRERPRKGGPPGR